METSSRIVADSRYTFMNRLTTFEIVIHRFMLPEFNTHRLFSRNSASSRAIPLSKQLEKVRTNPALPAVWATEQKGMQGGAELTGEDANLAEELWREAAADAADYAERLGEHKVHKSLANRLLEPFMWHTIIVTSTDWENFFQQRCSPLAQPEIRAVAEMMREQYKSHKPASIDNNQWHLPYIEPEDVVAIQESPILAAELQLSAAKISAARCARVSYLTHDGKRDITADIDLFNKLVSAMPAHWSPLEHVATPWAANRQSEDLTFRGIHGHSQKLKVTDRPKVGNLVGWRSLRTEYETWMNQNTYK